MGREMERAWARKYKLGRAAVDGWRSWASIHAEWVAICVVCRLCLAQW